MYIHFGSGYQLNYNLNDLMVKNYLLKGLVGHDDNIFKFILIHILY